MKLASAVLAFSIIGTAQASDDLCAWFTFGGALYTLTDKPNDSMRVLEFVGDAYTKAAKPLNDLFSVSTEYNEEDRAQYLSSTFYEASTALCACFKVTDYSPKTKTISAYDSVKFNELSICYKEGIDPFHN